MVLMTWQSIVSIYKGLLGDWVISGDCKLLDLFGCIAKETTATFVAAPHV